MSQCLGAADPLMPPLRLAVDARDLAADGRGIGTYARALLSRFAQRDDLVLTLLVKDWFPPLAVRGLRAAIGAEQTAIRCANRVPGDSDVVWHPWNGTFFGGRAPAVATIHDLIPFALPAATAAQRAAQQRPFRRTAATARAILCDSAFTAADLARYLAVDPARTHVVPLGVDPAFAPGDSAALPPALRGRRFTLCVGAHDDHKNVGTLVKAHRLAFPAGDVALAFTHRGPLAGDALIFERVPQAVLIALYRAALLVAVPSLYEGFGLPVLEAMGCGAPVLAARATALPEAGGDVAAYVDEPRDVTAWAHALAQLVADPQRRAAMAAAGPQRAARFPWETCAQRTLEVLRSAHAPPVATGPAATC